MGILGFYFNYCVGFFGRVYVMFFVWMVGYIWKGYLGVWVVFLKVGGFLIRENIFIYLILIS